MIFWLCCIWMANAVDIQPWMLPNEPQRKELTQRYLSEHYVGSLSGVVEQDSYMAPKVIVLHWTASPTARSTWNTFASATLSGRTDIQSGGSLNVAAHFLVDRDGTVYQLLEETRVARHCIGLNHLSIGIENVGGGAKYPLTAAQVSANAELVRMLTATHDITHLIGHYEYRQMESHPYFSEKDPKYRTVKPDPGADFMRKVRAKLTDLQLQGAL